MVYAVTVYICVAHDITSVMQQSYKNTPVSLGVALWEKWVKTCKKGRLEGSLRVTVTHQTITRF